MNISCVIVAHNSPHLCVCLDALQLALADACTLLEQQEIILVADASTDATARLARKRFPGITIVESASRIGYTAAANRGIEQAQGDIIFFISPDVAVQQDAVRRMLEQFNLNAAVQVAGGRLTTQEGLRMTSAQRFPSVLGRFCARFGFAEHAPHSIMNWDAYGGKDMDTVSDVDWVSFTFAAVRKQVFVRYGLLDTRFYADFMDTDLCRRLGRSVHPVPRVVSVPQASAMYISSYVSSCTIENFLLEPESLRSSVRSEMLYLWKQHGYLLTGIHVAMNVLSSAIGWFFRHVIGMTSVPKRTYHVGILGETFKALLDTQFGSQYPATHW